jgi:hypothetical protein
VGLKRALLVGVAAPLVLASCGGSSDKASTAATSANAADTSTSSIASHVLTRHEIPPGFTPNRPSVGNTVKGYLAATETPPDQVASETKRLIRLGFVAGAHEDLPGSGGNDGVSIAEQFKTPAGARGEVANAIRLFKATTASSYKAFPVTGIPGAVGLGQTGQQGGVNVAFASGDYFYLVGAQLPAAASSEAKVIAAAKHLYGRVHG